MYLEQVDTAARLVTASRQLKLSSRELLGASRNMISGSRALIEDSAPDPRWSCARCTRTEPEAPIPPRPYLGTDEVLGGYWMIRVDSRNEAIG
jgi:hypothetical protein